MATVTGLTAARMLAIEAASIVDGSGVADDLILTRYDGAEINAGNVRGPQGQQGIPGDISVSPAGGALAGNYPNPTLAPDAVTLANLADQVMEFLIPTGAVLPFAGEIAPAGFLLANGATVDRTTYATLFGVIGETYGSGDDSTTFNLPDLRDSVPVGAESGETALGVKAGSHTLTEENLPSHAHDGSGLSAGSAGSHNHNIEGNWNLGIITMAGTADGGAHRYGNVTDATTRNTASTGNHTHPITGVTGAVGSGAEYRQPYLALNYIIKT